MKQDVFISKYDWKVSIYYTINAEDKKELNALLDSYQCSKDTRVAINKNIQNAIQDTGFTYSSYGNHHTLMVIHKASSIGEFVNTFEHEKLHLAMHICEALDINPYSEEAAHLLGDLSQQILEEVLCFIIEI